MGETKQPAKVTTESSQEILEAVAGRLANLETGELPVIRYVGPDGTSQQTISPAGELLNAPADVAAPGEGVVDPSLVHPDLDEWTLSDPAPSEKTPGRPPSGESTPATKVGFFARIAAWFHRGS